VSRYNPTRQVLVNGIDVSNDAYDIKFTDATTNKTGSFDIQLDDRRGRYSLGTYTTLAKFQPVTINLDGTLIFKGRIDKTEAIVEKKTHALTYEITGRSDLAVLTDTICSKHVVQESALQIVNEIIDLQNALALSQDPKLTIPLNANQADNTIKLNFQWKRKSLQEMLYDVSIKLGAATAQGGVGTFYDFWATPQDNFYFVPAGSIPSDNWVNLGYPGGIEEQERHFVTDANTVKTEVWVWAQNTAASAGLGRIPLTMQPTYGGNQVDSWTEGNSADYTTSGTQGVTISDENTAANVIFGKASIHINAQPDVRGNSTIPFAWWAMPMPFGSGPKWAGQPPNSLMNTYNETGIMSETDGQMSALTFFFKASTSLGLYALGLTVYATDVYGNVAISPLQSYTATTNAALNNFQAMAVPFGPDSNWQILSSVVTPAFFDWTSIAQIKYQPSITGVLAPVGAVDLWFDGFAIVKPLVVHVTQTGATSRRAQTYVQSGILTYADALNYAQAQLESLMQPQTYYEIKNIGRNDIPAGYLFIAEGQQLIARSVDYTYNKTQDGWIIDVKGFAKT
jgi:hypothetical protein